MATAMNARQAMKQANTIVKRAEKGAVGGEKREHAAAKIDDLQKGLIQSGNNHSLSSWVSPNSWKSWFAGTADNSNPNKSAIEDLNKKKDALLGTTPQRETPATTSKSSLFSAAKTVVKAAVVVETFSNIAAAAADGVTKIITSNQIVAKSADEMQLAVKACIPEIMPLGGCMPDPFSIIPKAFLTTAQYINQTVINGTTYVYAHFPVNASVISSVMYAFGDSTPKEQADAITYFTNNCTLATMGKGLLKAGTPLLNTTSPEFTVAFPSNPNITFVGTLIHGTEGFLAYMMNLPAELAAAALDALNSWCYVKPNDDGSGGGLSTGWKIGLGVGIPVVAILLYCGVVYCCKNRNRERALNQALLLPRLGRAHIQIFQQIANLGALNSEQQVQDKATIGALADNDPMGPEVIAALRRFAQLPVDDNPITQAHMDAVNAYVGVGVQVEE